MAAAVTEKARTAALTLTVTITPSTRHSPNRAPFAAATDDAITHGTPGEMPRATSAAASAAASAAPTTSALTTRARHSGATRRSVDTIVARTATARIEPAPRSPLIRGTALSVAQFACFTARWRVRNLLHSLSRIREDDPSVNLLFQREHKVGFLVFRCDWMPLASVGRRSLKGCRRGPHFVRRAPPRREPEAGVSRAAVRSGTLRAQDIRRE